jgi:hypothetical protein
LEACTARFTILTEKAYRVMQLNIDSRVHDIDADPEMPLLWVLRAMLGITGVKYGCEIAQCGACSVHIHGAAVRSCQITAGNVRGADPVVWGALCAGGRGPANRVWAAHLPRLGRRQCHAPPPRWPSPSLPSRVSACERCLFPNPSASHEWPALIASSEN